MHVTRTYTSHAHIHTLAAHIFIAIVRYDEKQNTELFQPEDNRVCVYIYI
jgi:hypothetical protein